MKNISVRALVRRVNDSPRIKVLFKIFSCIAFLLTVFAFLYMLWHFLNVSIGHFVKYLVVLGFPFLIVSGLRKFLKAPRPYEIYDFFENPPRKGKMDSFPSRHGFSVFAIGTLCLFVSPVLGAITLAFGALLCFCRVAEGIHFVRDVVAGGLIGVISSLIGALVLV